MKRGMRRVKTNPDKPWVCCLATDETDCIIDLVGGCIGRHIVCGDPIYGFTPVGVVADTTA